MFFVSRSVEQRNHAAPLFQPFDLPQQLLLVLQFFAVFLLEGSPFVGIVREPFAQSIGGRNVPQPQIDSGSVLGEPQLSTLVSEGPTRAISSSTGRMACDSAISV